MALAASADVFLLSDTGYIALDNALLNEIMEAHPRLGYRVIREIARIEARRLRRACQLTECHRTIRFIPMSPLSKAFLKYTAGCHCFQNTLHPPPYPGGQ